MPDIFLMILVSCIMQQADLLMIIVSRKPLVSTNIMYRNVCVMLHNVMYVQIM